MRKRVGILLMLMGSVMILAAAALIVNNQQENRLAQEASRDVIPILRGQILQAREIEEITPEVSEYTPEEYIDPEDLIMTEKIVNGYGYIGYLTIPDLNLELPVMSGWDSRRLQIAPCRYTGTLRGGDLVVMAHNYSSHFGRLSELSLGSQVQFADMDGRVWLYQVVAMDVLDAEAVNEMTAGEYDLTLFTCAKNRTHRVTIRCDRADKNK